MGYTDLLLRATNALAQEGGKNDALIVALEIGLPILIAYAAFYLLSEREESGWPTWLKWLAFVPIVVGILLCGPYFFGALGWTVDGSFYADLHGLGTKQLIMHYASLPLELLAGVGLVAWNVLRTKRQEQEFRL